MGNDFQRVKIWDPVTRVWHWALALSVTLGWSLGEFRSFSLIQWHFYLGYTTGALVVFRYLWGFVGPTPVRHRTLLASLASLFTDARGMFSREYSGTPGHSSLGVLSIVAIVLLLTIQVSSGLFSEDDGLFSAGPLASEVSGQTVRLMTRIHNVGAKVILALVVLHVSAIAFYWLWKRENLLTPMLTGWKWVRKSR